MFVHAVYVEDMWRVLISHSSGEIVVFERQIDWSPTSIFIYTYVYISVSKGKDWFKGKTNSRM